MSSSGHGHGHDDGAVHAHISPTKFYIGIFVALITLTVMTVGQSYVDLGRANLITVIVIASIKASLVVMFFMHLRYDNKFNALMFVSSLGFIGVFFAYTMNDTDRRRNELNDTTGEYVLPSNGEAAPGGPPPKPTSEPAKHDEGKGGHDEHSGGHEGDKPHH